MTSGKSNPSLEAMAAAAAEPAPDFAEAEIGAEITPRLPPDSPVTPLGMNGNKIIFLDGHNQLMVHAPKCDKSELVLWFGLDFLIDTYPEKGKHRWDQREPQEALIMACFDLGLFDPKGRVFGRGAHRGPIGGRELILHMGRDVLIADPGAEKYEDRVRIVRAGKINVNEQSLYYPAAPPLPRPAAKAASNEDVKELLEMFGRFFFVNAEPSPLLLLGMLAQMYVCGALKWRAHAWITAPTGAGKTTLQTIFRECMADWCLYTEDTTEAAIRGVLKDDTLPVLIDEAEAHDNPERNQRILNLVKKSSAGGKTYRGTAEGGANEFTSQSCFLLSSVLHAPLRGEDRNRLAIIEMQRIPDNAPPLQFDEQTWRSRGRGFHRRMIDHWWRWEATYDEYRHEIRRLGFDPRAADTYGTLLACADLLLYDHHFAEDRNSSKVEVDRVSAAVNACVSMMQSSRDESEGDDVRCRRTLMGTMLKGAAGQPDEPVGRWIERVMEPLDDLPNQAAIDKLKMHGLMVVNLTEMTARGYKYHQARPKDYNEAFLAVAGKANRPLLDLFKGTDWQGGGWTQSLSKVEGKKQSVVRFYDGPARCVCVPLNKMLFRDED